jgi:hypothetical protein
MLSRWLQGEMSAPSNLNFSESMHADGFLGCAAYSIPCSVMTVSNDLTHANHADTHCDLKVGRVGSP